MTLRTRKPTGVPPWPILLLAGVEKSGKSWACATASGSAMVGRTLWLSIGEDDPDEYANVPGADFEIVQHDGTFKGIMLALKAIADEPAGEKPTLLVVDSMTRLWDLLCDEAQKTANQRATKRNRGRAPDDDVPISMDLWNRAKDRWGLVIDMLRRHPGPVLVTARLELVTLMKDGQPTAAKDWKVKAEKSLPYDVTGTVELPRRGEAWLSGVRSVRLQLPERTQIKEFTVEDLWHKLGLTDAGERHHSGVQVDAAAAARDELRSWLQSAGIDLQEAVDRWAAEHDGAALAASEDADGIRAMTEAWKAEIAQQTPEEVPA